MEASDLFGEDLPTRQAHFQQWVRDVRDPAETAKEGVRRIVVRGAIAEYEIAPPPHGRWAIHFGLEYGCGDFHGHHAPWTEFSSREACVAAFLDAARRHFGARLMGVAEGVTAQDAARTAMLKQLQTGGLFGFVEPDIDHNAAR